MKALALLSDENTSDVVFSDDEKPAVRAAIQEFEDWLATLPQEDIPVKHIFSDGLYLREGYITAGTVLTGAIHLDEHANIISQGSLRILTEDGIKTFSAPATFICRPGVKKVGVVIADAVMTNIHPNPENLRDVDAIEARLFVRDYPALTARKES
jgi:hypothetical protein